ncbi:MAG: hypothetical protein M1538_02085 [Candidatus Marsarchaeota archaeon]|jgi:hypothetical protein|nr:hypothetical protein [Candidatus Marsarchaeota archaeon]
MNEILDKIKLKITKFDDCKIKNYKIADMLYISALIMAIILLFMNYLGVATIIIVLCGSVYLYKKHQNKKPSHINNINDLIAFLNILIKEYEHNKNLLNSLTNAAKGKFFFSDQLNNILQKYKLGVNKASEFNISNYKLLELNVTINSIIAGLNSGKDILYNLQNIKESLERKRQQMLKTYGILKNTYSINKLSNIIFLPIFAGISINIINFSSFLNNSAQSIMEISLIFVVYIFIINYINSLNLDKEVNIKEALLLSSISFLIFIISKTFVSNIW